MKIRHIIWLHEFEEKLFHKHNVLSEEVEEVLFDKPHIRFVEKGHCDDEDLYAAYGKTSGGRWLIIFFVLKNKHDALVISARTMDRKERHLYARR